MSDDNNAEPSEPDDFDRYVYSRVTIRDYVLRLRDDGYRIWFKGLGPNDPDKWFLWAEYKQCELIGIADELAAAVMRIGTLETPPDPPWAEEARKAGWTPPSIRASIWNRRARGS